MASIPKRLNIFFPFVEMTMMNEKQITTNPQTK